MGGGISSNSSSGTAKASTLVEYDVPSRSSFVTFVWYLKNSTSCFLKLALNLTCFYRKITLAPNYIIPNNITLDLHLHDLNIIQVNMTTKTHLTWSLCENYDIYHESVKKECVIPQQCKPISLFSESFFFAYSRAGAAEHHGTRSKLLSSKHTELLTNPILIITRSIYYINHQLYQLYQSSVLNFRKICFTYNLI